MGSPTSWINTSRYIHMGSCHYIELQTVVAMLQLELLSLDKVIGRVSMLTWDRLAEK